MSKLSLGLIALLFSQSVFANSAYPGKIVEQQPDGSTVELRLQGDEYLNWVEDTNGYTVINNQGQYEYAKTDSNGQLVSNGLIVGVDDPKVAGITKHITPAPTRLHNFTSNPPQQANASGNVKNLVVMIRFSNHTNRTLPTQSNVDVLFNTVGGDATLAPTGSVRDYYTETSYGQMTLDSGVSNWVTVSNTEQYYANGASGLSNKIHEAITEALNLLDPTVNFSDYDTDNDGVIDAITFIHSGYGAEWGGTDVDGTDYTDRIWSHRWSMSQWTSAEGVSVSDYHISPSLWNTSGQDIGRIGVIAHETGHFFGLPDLYDYGNDGSGIGSYGLMANSWGFDGSQLYPPHFSAWSKIQLGWVTPTTITQNGVYSLVEAETSPTIYRIDQGFPSGEYLLVENRQAVGFDGIMPQGGLAIWHVDDNTPTPMTQGFPSQAGWPGNGKHYRVALLQADGDYGLERNFNRGDSGDVYHAAGVDNIQPGPVSHPNTDTYQSGIVGPTGNALIDISAASSTMTFCLNSCVASVPTVNSPVPGSTLSGSSENFSWSENGTNVDAWWIYAGSNVGAHDYYDSGSITTTSTTVTGLPVDGSTVHITLWYQVNGVWAAIHETYTAGGIPSITSPIPGSTLSGSSENFSWNANGANIVSWWVYAGSNVGAHDYYDSGSITTTSTTVTGLPVDGSTVYITLWYRPSGGAWVSIHETYTAVVVTPSIISPAAGSSLSGSSENFSWNANGTSVDAWWIYAGSNEGAHDYYDSGSITTTSTSITGLPTDASTVHITLWYKINGVWAAIHETYTAFAGPGVTSPLSGSILAGTDQYFTWDANGANVSSWWVYAGSSIGVHDYYDTGSLGAVAGTLVGGLPTDGSTVYIRLWYLIGTSWLSVDTTYIASNPSGDSYEPDNTSAEAKTIQDGQPQTHSIHVGDDTDWVTFTLTAPTNIVLETTGGEDDDTRMWLYDSTLTQLEFDDDDGTGFFSLISFQNLAAGTYYVKIDEFGNNNIINSYNLSLTLNSTQAGLPHDNTGVKE